MSRAFYAMPRPQQIAFRIAVKDVRDSRPGGVMAEDAFLSLDIDRATVERTHTLDLHALVADRLALTHESLRSAIRVTLFGDAPPFGRPRP